MNKMKPTYEILAGTGDVGVCCSCDTADGHNRHQIHVNQYELFLCKNPQCDHYTCRVHRQPCGFCEGCCAEEHGLGSHDAHH